MLTYYYICGQQTLQTHHTISLFIREATNSHHKINQAVIAFTHAGLDWISAAQALTCGRASNSLFALVRNKNIKTGRW
ncbi:hypothetical protein HanIR_Chr01g0001981 [Helianthus annuus]|nr:hypothetical protein HanIR_Chr01g0001981 [Helianthus annuus]